MEDYELYVTSFYFTVTTIVTVGYGDIHAYNTVERVICIFLMIIGVIAFSFATGSLSSILSNYDASQAKLKEKIATLNDIRSDYDIGPELYDELRIAIKYDHSKNYNDVKQFLEELPYKLRIELAMEIHKDIYTNIEFFNAKDKSFIAWVGPLLKPLLASEQEYIFKEGDDIKESKNTNALTFFF
jgi:hyperpolarization activated cyclic nucleotide-gated potassium channel 1